MMGAAMRVVLVDNYDSFTWNLYHDLARLGAAVTVARNDSLSASDLIAAAPGAVVLSPGPCTPNEAGLCLDLIARAGPCLPILGVCLGLQAIGQAYGGRVVRAPKPMHGKVSTVLHDGGAVFQGIDGPFRATRYHSLVVERETLPDALRLTAWSGDGLVMGLSHREHPVHGVQFHPESILSEHGLVILQNFLDLAAGWATTHRAVPA